MQIFKVHNELYGVSSTDYFVSSSPHEVRKRFEQIKPNEDMRLIGIDSIGPVAGFTDEVAFDIAERLYDFVTQKRLREESKDKKRTVVTPNFRKEKKKK